MLITLFSCASKNTDVATSESANPSADVPAVSTDTTGTEEQQRAAGDQYTFLAAPGAMLTIDTYKDWFNKYAEAIGVDLPYAE